MFNFPEIPHPHGDILRAALASPRDALRRAQDLAPGRSPWEAGMVAYTNGCCLLACERFEQAGERLEAAGRHFAAVPDDVMGLYCRHARQFGALFTAAPTDTEPWDELLAEDQRRQLPAAALAAAGLARAYYHRRAMAEVDALIGAWLPSPAAASAPFVRGHLIRLQAAVALNQGRFDEAAATVRQAIAAFEAGECLIEATHCLIDLAWITLLQSQPRLALTMLQDADRVFQSHDLPLRRALCAHNLSIVYLQLGEFAHALYTSHEARRLFKQVGRPLDIGSCAMQLGRIYSYIGHWTTAIAQLLQSITIFDTFGAHGRMASCYYNLAVALTGKGDLEEALRISRQAEAFARSEGSQEILRELALLRARILGRLDQFGAAHQLFSEIDEQFAAINNQVGRARCWAEQGWLDLAMGAAEAARQRFTWAFPALQGHPVYQWRALHGLARCYHAAGEHAAALDYYHQGIQLVARFRRQFANEHLSSLLFVQIETLFSDALDCAIEHGPAELALRLTEYHRTVTLQRLLDTPLEGLPAPDVEPIQAALLELIKQWTAAADKQAALERVDRHLELYAEHIWLNRHTLPPPDLNGGDLDLARVSRRLSGLHGEDWTLVSFLIHGSTLLINIQMPQGVICHRTPWDREIELLIQQLGAPGSQRRIYNDVPFHQKVAPRRWQRLAELADRLLPPEVRRRLHPDHRLYIVPSGMLHMLAWPTLRVGESWLCECAVIQVLPYMMFALREMGDPAATMLQLACGEFGDRADRLPAAVAELAEIQAVWPVRPDTLTDEACTLDAIVNADLESYGVIHIATHAYMTQRQGMAGHIVMRDGELWLDKITRLRLNRALVYMSTCNGAVIDSLPGEENISLLSSWLIAGAKAIVASLWPVADGSTIPLLSSFYGH
ncbi:MAG TPA: CHAT domain-containing tetratricopeptide repeat protein, partial [Herpetosiphonaceae bacterium]|nr:CHAT domain-containing tetratricopeptide repeat protein [Herpetosiphonaceae bacterium]